VGFVVNVAALRKVFSEYFFFPCQPFHRLLRAYHQPSSEAGAIGQIVADVPSGHSLSPPLKKLHAQSLVCTAVIRTSPNNRTGKNFDAMYVLYPTVATLVPIATKFLGSISGATQK
jgi:hypothetical protein